jgi:hypothetical protein
MIKIISSSDKNFNELSEISNKSIADYSNKHNLKFETRLVPDSFKIHPSWYKLDFLLDEFSNEKNNDIDYFLWIDSDAVILNMNFDINSIIDKSKFLHISKGFDTMNAGVFILKKTEMSKNFIEKTKLKTHYHEHPWLENMAMIDLIFHENHGFLENINFVSQKILNAYDYDLYPEFQQRQKDLGQYEQDSFIVHFPGMPKEQKIKNMKRVMGIL